MYKCTECKLAAICVPLGKNGLEERIRRCGVCGKPAVYVQVLYMPRHKSVNGPDLESAGWWRRINPPCLSSLTINPLDLIWCDTCSARKTPRHYYFDPLGRGGKK